MSKFRSRAVPATVSAILQDDRMLFADTASLRKSRGAFFTPDSVARFVAQWVVQSLNDAVLEPSCGEAVFLQAVGPESVAVRRARAAAASRAERAELAALADELGIPSEAELLRRQRELSAPDGSLRERP